MADQEDLLVAFIEFADTFVDDYEVVEFLHRLAERCVQLVNTSEAGIMLADRDGTSQHVASSNERVRLIELRELQLDQGPSLDTYRTGVAVHSGLAYDADDRWPRFAPDAKRAGFASVAVLPMRLRDDVIGVLDLFSESAVALESGDRRIAQALADIATIGILQERALHDGRLVTQQLESALASRVLMEQAKGLVAERLDTTIDVAFSLIRDYARSRDLPLKQAASEFIDGTVSTDVLTSPIRAPRA